jgi:uncharacterized protein (TIGR04141 family)
VRAPVDDRLFALTFGQGRFLLHPDAYEEWFGLVVTLNSIGSDALRSIDKRTFVDDQNILSAGRWFEIDKDFRDRR